MRVVFLQYLADLFSFLLALFWFSEKKRQNVNSRSVFNLGICLMNLQFKSIDFLF